MSMVGALSNYTASLSSNTTLLRDGQTLSGTVPSGLSVSAGSILGLVKRLQKRDRKRKILDTANGSNNLGQRMKKNNVSTSHLNTINNIPNSKKDKDNDKEKERKQMNNGSSSLNNNDYGDSDSDDEDGVMELLGESRTRKPVSSSSSSSVSSSSSSFSSSSSSSNTLTTSSQVP